jgi:hypothetical protein
MSSFSKKIVYGGEKSNKEYDSIFNEKDKFEDAETIKRIYKEDIILYSGVKQGVYLSFNYQNDRFMLRVVKVVWNLIGTDFIYIKLEEF